MDNSLGLNATIELYHFTNIKIARVKFPPRYKYAGLSFSRVLLGVKAGAQPRLFGLIGWVLSQNLCAYSTSITSQR